MMDYAAMPEPRRLRGLRAVLSHLAAPTTLVPPPVTPSSTSAAAVTSLASTFCNQFIIPLTLRRQ